MKLKLRDWNTLGYVDDDGASEALSYVRETKFGTDEFLYVNLMEAHTPYDPPAEYRTTDVTHGHGLLETITDADDGSLDRQEVARAYDDCVRYLSDVYEEMFDALVDAFDYVITLSDHGELLGEHGGWGHGYGLYEELTNVPMSVYGPDVQAGSVQHVVSLTDAFWTVIDLAADSDRHGERSVLEGGRTDSVLTEYHGFTRLRRNKLRDAGVDSDLLVRYDRLFRGIAGGDWYGFESPEGFDLSGGLDREEAKARLADRVRRLDRSESDDGGREMSEEVLHHLEELGYV